MNFYSFHQGKSLAAPDVSGEWIVRSPSNLDLELGRVTYSYSQIAWVTQALQEAQSAWGRQSFDDRKAAVVQAIVNLLNHREDWFKIAQTELGRADVDLEAEWTQFNAWFAHFKSSLTLDFPSDRQARGVVAVVGSYIWPLVHTIQGASLALLAGNAVVLKPSEKATLSSLKAAEWMCQSPQIQNLFSVIVGDRELGRRLVCHEGVQTVLFYGSFEVGMRVKQDTLSQPFKEVLLFLGAKNPSVVMNDAPESCVETLIRDAFLTTGQHCRNLSQIWVQDGTYASFLKRFHDASKLFKIDDPATGAYAGPLIDPSMLDRYLKFTGISEREGASILMRGKPLELKHKGNFVTPTLAAFEKMTPEILRKSVSLQTEILSPHVSIIRFTDEEEIQAFGKEMTHGLVASVWSNNRESAQRVAKRLPFGLVTVNRSVLSWDPARSFQPMKKSGNHAYHGPKLLEQFTLLKSSG